MNEKTLWRDRTDQFMRTCVLHIGTHKTATTTLQALASAHSAQLRTRNCLYPMTGRAPEGPDGHHNLAWEITGDRRFRREHGTAQDLLAEIDAWPGTVVISSEDFECSIYWPDKLARFIDSIESRGFKVRLVVYLRNQTDYIQSLYLELLKVGIPETFSQFVNIAVGSAQYRWREWVFTFCYKDLLQRIEALTRAEVIVRSYDAPRTGTIIGDFLGACGIDPAGIEMDMLKRANRRLPLSDTIRTFYSNQKGAALDPIESYLTNAIAAWLSSHPLEISDRSKRQILTRFFESNEYLAAHYQMPVLVPTTHARREADGAAVWMETVFSSELALGITEAAQGIRSDLAIIARERDAFGEQRDVAVRELATLQQRLENIEREHADLLRERDGLQRTRDAILNSRTWRLTGPLRRIRGFLR